MEIQGGGGIGPRHDEPALAVSTSRSMVSTPRSVPLPEHHAAQVVACRTGASLSTTRVLAPGKVARA